MHRPTRSRLIAWAVVSLLASSIVAVLAAGRAGSAALYVHPPEEGLECLACHPSAAPPAAAPAPGMQALDLPPEAALAHWWLGCTTCHTMHAGTANLHLVAEVIDTDALPPEYAVKTGLRRVVLSNEEGVNSYADGDAVYDGVCEVCHTRTAHHRGDASGDHAHFAGVRCTTCHDHANYFQPTKFANHPQAVSDCSNCHLGAGGKPDLPGLHKYDCQACHPAGFGGTILGVLGTWKGDCIECHNPSVAATGNLQTPTKGHRCVLCHATQQPVSSARGMHKEHIDKANCVVCHGFIPDTGTVIGSGNRAICAVCHSIATYDGIGQRDFHQRHVPKGASCLECHGGGRPPVDVVTAPAVGRSTNVCQVCHTSRSPAEFSGEMSGLHKKHVDAAMDCGMCHAAANLQDDRSPMPAIDDPLRARIDRSGYRECRFCHGSSEYESARGTHVRHLPGQSQWCFNCHDAADARPEGLVPPVTRPREACRLCHGDIVYTASSPFSVHEKHADRSVKCYACHQLTPPLSGWPSSWMLPPPSPTWTGSWSSGTWGR